MIRHCNLGKSSNSRIYSSILFLLLTFLVTDIFANNISSWEISGAMAGRSQKKGWNANVNWRQQGFNNYQIRLIGPIGSGSILVTKQGGVVSYRDGSKRDTASSADALLRKQAGIRLPVNNLYYWVRGVPAPGSVQAIKRNANQQIVMLKQAGYTIAYDRYSSVGKYALPSSIRLVGPDVSIKFIINRWKI